MTMHFKVLPIVVCVVILFSTPSLAQTPEPRQTDSTSQAREQSPNLPPNSSDTVANELELLRKSLQTLNARLREISDKYFAPDSKQSDSAKNQQSRIALNLDLLSHAEQRAEVMRKQLLELIDRYEAIRGIERGLHEMNSGKGKPLEQVDREIRKKHRIPRDA